jgi:hypothetical protein
VAAVAVGVKYLGRLEFDVQIEAAMSFLMRRRDPLLLVGSESPGPISPGERLPKDQQVIKAVISWAVNNDQRLSATRIYRSSRKNGSRYSK